MCKKTEYWIQNWEKQSTTSTTNMIKRITLKTWQHMKLENLKVYLYRMRILQQLKPAELHYTAQDDDEKVVELPGFFFFQVNTKGSYILSHQKPLTRVSFIWKLTCWIFGTINGLRASMVTTQGEIVVAKFLARNGPRGTYSHFWMSRAEKQNQ